MKFFLPMARDTAQADVLLESIARHISLPLPERRIFRLVFRHNGIEYEVEVGKAAPAYFGEGASPVEAILGDIQYAICLENRGVKKGLPIYAGDKSVRLIEFFDYDSSHLRGPV
jgi:hypothetical protein